MLAELPVSRARDALAVGLLALIARLSHAAFVSRTAFFEGPVIDAAVNRDLALHIAHTGDFGAAFYQPPLYAAFLALLFRLGLTSAWSIALLQAALGSAVAVALLFIGRSLAGHSHQARAVGLCSGLAAALYGPFVLFDLELLPAVLVHALLCAAWLLALRYRPLGLADALLGLCCGLAIVGWPPSALVVMALLWLRARRVAARAQLLALALGCMSLPLAACARHNAERGAPGVVVSYNAGVNLWLGNNPHWRETWRARPGAEFEPELERPDREGVTAPAERSKYFIELAVRDAVQRPVAALLRTGEKLYYVWHGREIRRDQDIETLREASPVLRVLLWNHGLSWPFGLLAPLALLAVWRRRSEPDVRCLALGAGAYALLLAVFFVSARYRLTLALLLMPLAADQALWLWRARMLPQARLALVPLASLAALLNWPNDFIRSFAASAAERGLLEAQALRGQGRVDRATELAAELVRRFPDEPNVLMLRAELAAADGQCTTAEPLLRRAVGLAPRTASPRLLLARCLEQRGLLQQAERELAGALALHPHHPLGLDQASRLLRCASESAARARKHSSNP